jgi:hypothetical protein
MKHRRGISRRAHCPVYLALKAEVLAIESALVKCVEKDFYVSDLWDIFRAVQERSVFEEVGVAVGDMNGDGKQDLVMADGGIQIRFQDPANPGKFLAPVVIATE